jgi:hypothetical protein
MIFRRYGNSVQSAAVDFDSKALTEIRFRRDDQASHSAADWAARYQRTGGHELEARAEGWVQDEVEQMLLADLEAQLRTIERALAPGEVLLVESEQGTDYPKTHTQQKTLVVEGQNKLHFTSTLRPPLRLGVYRPIEGAV